jgi:hypothetical protein
VAAAKPGPGFELELDQPARPIGNDRVADRPVAAVRTDAERTVEGDQVVGPAFDWPDPVVRGREGVEDRPDGLR